VRQRPKLLFLASPFPPYPAIGSVRTWNIARYLVRLGWDVTVVTPHPSSWRNVQNADEADARIRDAGIRRILTHHSWHCLDPDALKCRNEGISWFIGGICRRIARGLSIDSWATWANAAERACSNLAPGDVDLILATGSPFASFSLAKRLSDRLGCPYVLDYRDPWTGNPTDEHAIHGRVVNREANLLAGTAAITIVSPSWAATLNQRFGVGAKTHILTNGYDPEELANVRPIDFGHFAIVYTGTFYPPKRTISPLMAAIKNLKQLNVGREWYFHYYGEHGHHVSEEATRSGVIDCVVLHGMVRRSEALSAVRGAGVVVVVTTVNEDASQQDRGWVPAKVYEAIGLGTPTLLIAPVDSDLEEIAKSAELGRRFTGSDVGPISSFLADAMFGRVATTKATNRELYAWTEISKKLDCLLRNVMAQNSSMLHTRSTELTLSNSEANGRSG
jgi:hypothetical protein